MKLIRNNISVLENLNATSLQKSVPRDMQNTISTITLYGYSKDTIKSASRTGCTYREKRSDTSLQEKWLDTSCNGSNARNTSIYFLVHHQDGHQQTLSKGSKAMSQGKFACCSKSLRCIGRKNCGLIHIIVELPDMFPRSK